MKHITTLRLIFWLLIVFSFSCNKDKGVACISCLEKEKNLPPVANAGPDITLQFDIQNCQYQMAILDGAKLSKDPDGDIKQFKWRVIHPDYEYEVQNDQILSFTPTDNKEFLIELFVKDRYDASDKDTVKVFLENSLLNNNPPIKLNVLEITDVPKSSLDYNFISGSATKLLFTKGERFEIPNPENLTILDLEKKKWLEYSFKIPRIYFSTVIDDENIYIIGGFSVNGTDLYPIENSVEVYNMKSGSVSVFQLQEPRSGGSAFIFRNKLYNIGGLHPKGDHYVEIRNMEIYDLVTKTSSIIAFPNNSGPFTREGNKLYFSNNLEPSNPSASANLSIFDLESNSWTFSTLPIGISEYNKTGASLGQKIFWIGSGEVIKNNNNYDVGPQRIISYNIENNQSAYFCMPVHYKEDTHLEILSKNNKLLVYNKYTFTYRAGISQFGNIYDPLTGKWDNCQINSPGTFEYPFQNNNIIYSISNDKLYRIDY